MNKLLLISFLFLFVASCGSDAIVNGDALCEGDILIPFKENKGGNWGYVNLKGEIIISPEFNRKPSFCVNGNALIKDYSRKDDKTYYRFIKIKKGKVIKADSK